MIYVTVIDVNAAWQYMSSILKSVFDKHAPIIQKEVKGKTAPWLNKHIISLMSDRDKLLRKYRKSKSEYDTKCYQNIR